MVYVNERQSLLLIITSWEAELSSTLKRCVLQSEKSRDEPDCSGGW